MVHDIRTKLLAGAAITALLSGGLGAAVPISGIPAIRDQPAFGADVSGSSFGNPFAQPVEPLVEGTADPAAVESLIASLRAAIAGLPETARAEDYEAAIVFAIDQSGQSPVVVTAALAEVQNTAATRVEAMALNNVRLAQRRNANYGTGALAGSAVNFSLTTDDAPAVILGGGSNYS